MLSNKKIENVARENVNVYCWKCNWNIYETSLFWMA